jgi:hypothetical protein
MYGRLRRSIFWHAPGPRGQKLLSMPILRRNVAARRSAPTVPSAC